MKFVGNIFVKTFESCTFPREGEPKIGMHACLQIFEPIAHMIYVIDRSADLNKL